MRGRGNWYELPKKAPGLLLTPMITGESLRCIFNDCEAQVDHNLFEIISDDNDIISVLGIYLNSGAAFLSRELIGRANLGDGALKVEGIDWERTLVPKVELLKNIKKRAEKVFEKVANRAIKPISKEAKSKDRINFETKVLESLGFGAEQTRDVLDAVVGLVEERHKLPKLRTVKKKRRVEQDLGKLKEEVIEEILPNGVVRFPEGFVKGKVSYKEISIAAENVRLGANFFDKQDIVDGDGLHLMEIDSIEKGKFIVYAKKKNEYVVKVPDSKIVIKKTVKEYEIYVRQIRDELYKAFMEKCGDHNISENLAGQVLEENGLPNVR